MDSCHINLVHRAQLQRAGFAMAALLAATVACLNASRSVAADADAASPDTSQANSVLLEEVVVTAQRRQESIQNVAISMAAYSRDEIQQLGMQNVQDLSLYTPNVSYTNFFEAGKPQIAIRGYSIGDLFTDFEQSPVGIYDDGVYVGSRSGQLAQMFDLDRVEVLRGPQGTLFGRNTSAGAIEFITKKPSNEFEADAEVTYGRWNELDFNGGITVPLTDTLSIRVAGIRRQRDGWQFNVITGQRMDDIDNWGARMLVQWQPTSTMTWLLTVYGNGNDTTTPIVHADLGSDGTYAPNAYTGYLVPQAWNQVASTSPVYEKLNANGATLTGTIGLGAMTLTSISAYAKTDYKEGEDDDDSPIDVGGFSSDDSVTQFSQELRLAAKQGSFDWVAGLYYYMDHLQQYTNAFAFTDPFFVPTPFASFAAYIDNDSSQETHNEAVFADVKYALASQWTLDLGARYTWETKHIHGVASQNLPFFDTGWFPTIGGPGQPNSYLTNSWSAPTGRAALEWRPTIGVMNYLSYSRGWKSGGYNGLAGSDVTELGPYNPETDNAYELGTKTEWFGGRLIANADVFLNKIKNYQALYVTTVNFETLFFVKNAAAGTSKGAEIEIAAQPGGGFSFSFGLGLLNTRYDSYVLPGVDYTGESFVNAPRADGSAIAQYSFPLFGGTLAPDVAYSYRTYIWTDNPHRPGIDYIPGYGLLSANIPWTSPNGRLRLSIWGENLTNKEYYITTVGNNYLTDGAASSYHGVPRTYGIRVSYTVGK